VSRIANSVRENKLSQAKINVRAQAVVVLDAVLHEGRSLSTALPDQLANIDVAVDRKLLQELCFGTLRWLPRLQFLAAQLLSKPLRSKDRDIACLIWLGLYQLIYTRVPPHAAVAETVGVAHQLRKSWASGLVNSVLRNFQRQQDALEARVDSDEQAHFAHPRWLMEAIAEAWPDDWPAILQANQRRPPMTLRVNLSRVSRSQYLEQLAEHNLGAYSHPLVGSAIILERPVDVQVLPGFLQGLVSVQDAAAQFAPGLLDLQVGQRVLDACAAPGGKTCHLLENQSSLDLIAMDIDSIRLQRIAENLQRLHYSADLICGDAAQPQSWWDGQLFDRILLDAPCSATGVIRRHPDIKYLRKVEDIPALIEKQKAILDALWAMLRPGGRLVYVTCSVLPQENHLQLQRFLRSHTEAEEYKVDQPWGKVMPVGRQILNTDALSEAGAMDGFYYAVLNKQI
jgi:16S rRNA (cytosine967-C5)-methyltransferase